MVSSTVTRRRVRGLWVWDSLRCRQCGGPLTAIALRRDGRYVDDPRPSDADICVGCVRRALRRAAELSQPELEGAIGD